MSGEWLVASKDPPLSPLATSHSPLTTERRLRPRTSDAIFHRFVDETGADVREITAFLAAGTIGAEEWSGLMLETLAHAHAHAGYLGRQRAGDAAPFDADDERFGNLVAQEEWPFLAKFQADIETGWGMREDGSLDVDRVQRRAAMYVTRTFGTANEALALVAGSDEIWHWKTNPGENCPDCLRLEAHSPYRGRPPIMPRQNGTRCLGNCHCEAFTASGMRGFGP